MRIPKTIWLAGSLTFAAALTIPALTPGLFSAPQSPASAAVPVVKNDAGSCTADFVVTDASGKGIYNVKIEIEIRYGTLGLHRLDSVIGTNSDGKARMEGLPSQIKRPAQFAVTYANQSKSFVYDPDTACHATHEVLFYR